MLGKAELLCLSASQCNDSEVDEETYKTGHTIRMYDINAKSSAARCMYTLRQHEATINAVAFSPDGSKFASVSDDHTMIIWDSLVSRALRRSICEELTLSSNRPEKFCGAMKLIRSW